MKTAELIRLLQTVDPNGKEDVCVENVDIDTVYITHASEGGWYQRLNKDSSGSVSSADYVGTGNKVVISMYSLASVVRDYPNIKVQVIGDDNIGHISQIVEHWREEAIKPLTRIPLPGDDVGDDFWENGQQANYDEDGNDDDEDDE